MKPSPKAAETEVKFLYALLEAIPAVIPDVTQKVMGGFDEAEAGEWVPKKTRVQVAPGQWRLPAKASKAGGALRDVEITFVVDAERQGANQMDVEVRHEELAVSVQVSESGVQFNEHMFLPVGSIDGEAIEQVLLRAGLGINDGEDEEEWSHGDEEDDEDEEGETGDGDEDADDA